MCGFVGQLGDLDENERLYLALNSIKHRGPDNLNYFFSRDINLGFARLSIQDLSQVSNQPISHPSGKFIMVFNGEIYNHFELRKYIQKKQNKELLSSSESDTITLLALLEELGIKKTLSLIQGMFSLAVYFFKEKKMFLFRDHFGQKPLFYTFENDKFIFGSEIKSLLILKEKSLSIDKRSIILPFLQSHLPDSDRTLFENIFSVLPGEFIVIDKNMNLNKYSYFEPSDLISEDLYKYYDRCNEKSLVEKYTSTLEKSISNHLISDVPIGTLFSAGLDSSIIARKAEDFGFDYRVGFNTITGEDNKYFTSFDSKSISDTNFYSDKEEEEIINLPKLLYMYETINKPDGLILSNLTKKARNEGFKVLLNGDSSDELFCGYQTYLDLYNKSSILDSPMKKMTLKIFRKLFPEMISNTNYDNTMINFYNFVPNEIELLEPYLDTFQYKHSNLKFWNTCLNNFDFIKSKKEKFLMSFSLNELSKRLPRYLHRSDTYGMMNSVEMRAPYLDLDFVKLALNTPLRFKIKKSPLRIKNYLINKYILKEVAKRFNVPKNIIYRYKKGTSFRYHNSMLKIIEKYPLNLAAEILSLSESRLRSSILERNYIVNYPIDVLNRYAYNILSIQILSEIFIFGISHEDISDRFRKILFCK